MIDMMKHKHLILVGLFVLVIVALASPILTYPLGRDQGEFATIGRGLLDGRVPYTDLWNPKPPAVFVVYSAVIALFGETTQAIRLIDLMLFVGMTPALYWIARGWDVTAGASRSGLIAIAGFGAFYFSESFWTLSQNDGIALLPMVLSAVFALKTLDNQRSALWAGLAGVMCGVVIWFKYPFGLFALALIVAQIINRRGEWRRLRTEAVAFALGGGVVLGAGALVLHQLGALNAMIESARVTSEYTRLSYADIFGAVTWEQALTDRWRQWGVLVPLVMIYPLVLWRDPFTNPVSRVIGLWLVSAVLILLVQAKGYDYHWLPMLPPLVLIAAWSITALIQRLPSRLPRVWLSGGVIGVLLVMLFGRVWLPNMDYLTGAQDRLAYYEGFRGGEFVAGESHRVVDYLRERNVYGDSLFIYGFRAEVYYLTGLRPATRFIFQFPLVGAWYPATWRQENVDVLWAALPPYVLVLRGDFMPWVTGRDLDSNSLLQEDTELNNWLIFNYELDAEIDNFLIYHRKASPGG